MSLIRKRIDVSNLSKDQKDNMFSLMKTYYENSQRSVFEKDLEEKKWVLMLFDKTSNKIAGFSTQMLIPINFKGKYVTILFSGDTIIAKEHWGSMELILCFGDLMINLLKDNKDCVLYWMLISKGIRTYKYLPTFFIEYYPNVKNETPCEILDLMHFLGEMKFSKSYDWGKGIVKALPNSQFLKKEFHREPNPKKAHEVFFAKANPDYLKGDELLCLARLSMDNINPFIRRILNNIE